MGLSWGRIAAVAALVTLLVTASARATGVPAVTKFVAPEQFGAGRFPVAIAAGDVTGDGIPDLVTANRDAGSMSLLAGIGSGRFAPAVNYPLGKGTSDVIVADLDGDGALDVVLTNRGSRTLSVFFNNAGVLGGPLTLKTGRGPSAVAAGDFNGDGETDLAVANASDNTVSLLAGDGARGFASLGAPTTVGVDPESLAVADFDGNGTLDLAVANRGGADLSILSGDGHGGFAVQSVTVGSTPTAVAARDLNGDGHADLVASIKVGDPGFANSVAVLLWNGGFPTVVSYGKTSPHPTSVAIDDLNADGYPDVAIGSGDSAQASVLWGTGNGQFDPKGPRLFAAGRAPIGVAISDLNGDGKPDLAFADSFLNGATVVPGNGSQMLQLTPTAGLKGSSPVAAAVGDLNGDDILDAVSANSGSANVSILLGKAAPDRGRFALKQVVAVGSTPNDVALADLNADGRLDLVTANRAAGSISIWRGAGDGTFTAWTPSRDVAVGSTPHAVAVADLNADGRPDLVVANMGSDNVAVLLNRGDGTFAATAFPEAAGSQPVSIAVAELTGDGVPDVAVADYGSNKVAVHPGNGDGSLGPPTTYSVGVHPTAVTGKDVNGDLRDDLVVTNRGSDTVSVLLANGSALQPAINSPVGVGYKPVGVEVTDLNGDGVPDLAVALSGGTTDSDFCHARGGPSGGITLLVGDGSGSFSLGTSYASLNDACDVAIGDLNGDSQPDIAVPAARTGVVESYLSEAP